MQTQINTADIHSGNAPGIEFDIIFAVCWLYQEIAVQFGEALQRT